MGIYAEMWGFMGIADRRCKFFCGDEKMKYFVWGMRGDVPTQIFVRGDHPHTNSFCVGQIRNLKSEI